MQKLKISFLFLLSLILLTCTKEEDSLTYLKAVINNSKSLLIHVEAKITKFPIQNSSDSIEQLSIYGLNNSFQKVVIIDLQSLKITPNIYQFGNVTDSVFLVKGSFNLDTGFYCTAYDGYSVYPGILEITQIDNNYVKGNFEFNAALRNETDSILNVTHGVFFAKIR